MTRSHHLAALIVTLSIGCGACRSNSDFFEPRSDNNRPRSVRLEEASNELNTAELELAEGNPDQAFERLQAVRDQSDLDYQLRQRTELLVEQCAVQLLTFLIENDGTVGQFEDLFEEDVPKRIRVSAGIMAARRHMELDDPIEAYSSIRLVDEEFGSHHERAAAGNILANVGFALSESTERYLGIFSFKARAPEVLEYLVLNYPSSAFGERAYLTLAALYEEDDELELALERYEDLLLYYRSSDYVPYAEARIPALRLDILVGPEYDRAQILSAKLELQAWLARHPNHELKNDVLDSLDRCHGLQMESDLSIAEFYRRVDKTIGARLHADRALELAISVGDQTRAQRARKILEEVAPVEAASGSGEDNS